MINFHERMPFVVHLLLDSELTHSIARSNDSVSNGQNRHLPNIILAGELIVNDTHAVCLDNMPVFESAAARNQMRLITIR